MGRIPSDWSKDALSLIGETFVPLSPRPASDFYSIFLRKEFQKIAIATAIGFALMGFIGFFVKLIHIPINNIIVGS